MKIFFTVILSILLLMTTAQAAKVDAYRNMLSSGRFTIKYTFKESPIRVTNKKFTITNVNIFFNAFNTREGIAAQSYRFLNNHKGVVTFDGANRYFERLDIAKNNEDKYPENLRNWNIAQVSIVSVLKKNGETFRFRVIPNGNKNEYYANSAFNGGKFHGKNKVFANEEEELGIMNAVDTLKEDYSYGILTTALIPIITPDKVIATPYTPEYKFIGSGTLNGGLTYEDFFGSKNGFNCAIRYYFNGDALSKIAVFNYIVKNSQVQSYEKYLVEIDEFSPTPDQSYLSLPAEIKDETKRDKGAKK